MCAKPRMLIAEDSETLAIAYKQHFGAHFDIDLTRGGKHAFSLVDAKGPWEIALVDIIMPSESAEADVEETGVRLIRRLVEREKCSRVVVVTVRWDIESIVREAVGDGAHFRVLLKQEVEPEALMRTVQELMTRTGTPLHSHPKLGPWCSSLKDCVDRLADLGAPRPASETELLATLGSIEQVLLLVPPGVEASSHAKNLLARTCGHLTHIGSQNWPASVRSRVNALVVKVGNLMGAYC